MKKILSYIGLISLCLVFIYSCTEKAVTGPQFIYKASSSKADAFKFKGNTISNKELLEGIENEIYEHNKKIFDLKMGRVKAIILQRLIESDARKGDLTNDQFLEKYIAKDVKPSKSDIQDFVKKRGIPKQHINDQMKERIAKFLSSELKQRAIESWIAEQSKKNPAEVYFEKPLRPVYDVKVGDAPFMGRKDASVTVVEYSDFQCPFCAKGSKIINQIKDKYGEKVKVVFKNFPLPFHKLAKTAAVAGLCANEQGKNYFWKMHDLMFDNQSKLNKKDLKEIAKNFKGFDQAKFDDCLDKDKYMAKVNSDIEEGKKIGVKSTPTFFVNGKVINGAHPLEVFSELIDQDLK